MVMNKKVTGKAMSMPAGLSVGLAVSIVVTLIATAVTANLVLAQRVGESAIGYIAVIVLLLASAMGSWLAAALIKRRWMVVCLATGGIYYLALLATTALFFGGQYQGMGVTAMAVLGGCGAIGLLGLRGESRSRNRVKKYRPR